MGYAKESGFCPDGPASGHKAGQRRAEKVWGLCGGHRGHTQGRIEMHTLGVVIVKDGQLFPSPFYAIKFFYNEHVLSLSPREKNRIFHLTLWPSRNPCGQKQKKGKNERHISWVVIWTFEISFKCFQSLTCKVKITPSHSCIHALTDVFIQQICLTPDPGRHSPRFTKPNLWQRKWNMNLRARGWWSPGDR